MAWTRPVIPPAVIRRLTRYLSHLQYLGQKGTEWVSSGDLGLALGLTSSTVRQDLRCLDYSGVSKRGYRVADLRLDLSRFLGADVSWNAVVVGAGNLGRALALHEDFARRGFRILGIFDADPKKVGGRVGSLTVRGVEDLPTTIVAKKIEIGILAVPGPAAQEVADMLILSGIRGLLNLTVSHVVAPRGVPVIDARIASSLIELSHAIRNVKGPRYSG